MGDSMRERKIFIWIDGEQKVNVSLAHRSEEELRDAYDWESNERLLRALPFQLEGAEGFREETPERYYRAIEGLLALSGIEVVLEVLLARMVREGIDLEKQHLVPREIIQ